jgi:hypothetical protein
MSNDMSLAASPIPADTLAQRSLYRIRERKSTLGVQSR